jgi:FixJ family two-component response regulator
MLTGQAMRDVAREGMKSGAFDYMAKPAGIEDLIYKIKDAYQKKYLQEAKIKRIENIIKEKD